MRQSNLHVDSLSIGHGFSVPAERVHPHNAQPSKTLSVDANFDHSYDPVREAKLLGLKNNQRDKKKKEIVDDFLKVTKTRSNFNPDATNEEVEKLKQKFRAASYTTTHGYDYGALFDRIDKDGGGSLDVDEFLAFVKKMCPDMTDRQLKNMLKYADEDGSGTLERDEFIEFLGSGKQEESFDSGAVTLTKSTFEQEFTEVHLRALEFIQIIYYFKFNSFSFLIQADLFHGNFLKMIRATTA